MRLSIPTAFAWTAVICVVLGLSARAAEDLSKNPKLVITSAVYGDLANDKTVDVLKKVSAAVKDNNLNITVGKEMFTDPAPGAAKKLKVGYTLDGLYYSKTVDDGDVCDISTRLFISKAQYGDLAGKQADDVTEQVKKLVRKNSLSVKADNDSFGDPAPNVVKKLRVVYTFDGVRKTKTVGENETLTISEKGE